MEMLRYGTLAGSSHHACPGPADVSEVHGQRSTRLVCGRQNSIHTGDGRREYLRDEVLVGIALVGDPPVLNQG